MVMLSLITDPLDIVPEAKYPAFDSSIYNWAYPTTKKPLLRCPYTLGDKDNNILEPGIYEVGLSDDEKFLLLYQTKKLKMKVPVVSLETLPKQEEDTPETAKKKKKEKKTDEKYKQVQEEYKLQAKLKAEIIESNKGYFILKYKDTKVKAVGYIPY